MTACAVLADLQGAGVRVEAVDGRLRLDAPKGTLTPHLLGLIREHKADLLATLGARTPTFNLDKHVHEPNPNDAADAGLLRWIAEGRPMFRPPLLASSFGGPDGWMVESWIGRPRQLADVCEPYNRGAAELHRAEADRMRLAVTRAIR